MTDLLEANLPLGTLILPKEKNDKKKPGAKRHHVASGTLAPLYTVFELKLACSGAAALIGDKVL